MADEKTYTDGIEPEVAAELTDEELEHVAGGADDYDACPQCGSNDYVWKGELRACVCLQCGYSD